MPNASLSPREALDQLDTRQEELIRQLDELNAQIEKALAEFLARRDASRQLQEARPAERRQAA